MSEAEILVFETLGDNCYAKSVRALMASHSTLLAHIQIKWLQERVKSSTLPATLDTGVRGMTEWLRSRGKSIAGNTPKHVLQKRLLELSKNDTKNILAHAVVPSLDNLKSLPVGSAREMISSLLATVTREVVQVQLQEIFILLNAWVMTTKDEFMTLLIEQSTWNKKNLKYLFHAMRLVYCLVRQTPEDVLQFISVVGCFSKSRRIPLKKS